MPWFAAALFLLAVTDEQQIRDKLKAGTGIIELPEGVVEVSSELEIPATAHDLTIRGNKTVLRAATTFKGRAIFVASGGRNIQFRDFEIAGSRAALAQPAGLPPSDVPFTRFTKYNAILAENVQGLTVADLAIREIAGFGVLVSRSSKVRIEKVSIQDSGSQNAKKHNNGTGGILLEEGTTDFEVLRCDLKNIRGNGIWTHSRYTSPRNARGRIAENTLRFIGRDAIQVGHATEIHVEKNTAEQIGFPVNEVDAEGGGIPVAIDTAGNTDKSVYAENHFAEINGKCIDLDGFHDGEIRGNICENREPPETYPYGNYGIVMNNSNPDMQSRNVIIRDNTLDGTLFGGIFVIGTGNRILNNHLLRINLAHCNLNAQAGCNYAKDEPDLLRTGIYLGKGAERPAPAQGNIVEGNDITGFGMGRHCITTAPGIDPSRNKIGRNECSDDAPVYAGNRLYQLPVR